MILGFDDFNVVWETSSQQFWVMDSREFANWQMKVFGRRFSSTVPDPVVNTPTRTRSRVGPCKSRLDARPSMLALNEARVTSTLRTINTAQVTFAATYGQGFTDGLNRLGPPDNGPPSENAADLVDPLISGYCSGGTDTVFEAWGYRFVYVPGSAEFGRIAKYRLTARPAQLGMTGWRSFSTDESGVIRWTRENRAATAHDPPL